LSPTITLFQIGGDQRQELTALLKARGFQVQQCHSISGLEKRQPGKEGGVVILDLDDPLVDNRMIRDVKRTRPALQVIGISRRPFHPELKEAITNHIYACLCKPVDPDELVYLVKSILCSATSSE
jgi:DNA-binding NtrC family response regulator